MSEISKTAKEKVAKEIEMQKILTALTEAGFPVERINDYGTLAYMVEEGYLADRFITIKVVVTKEYNEEKNTGFSISEAMEAYEDRVKSDAEKALKTASKKSK